MDIHMHILIRSLCLLNSVATASPLSFAAALVLLQTVESASTFDSAAMLSDVLTQQQLARLKEHKYSVSGVSLMEPPLQVYWRWLVTKLPLWLAPNLITFMGLMLNVATTVILMVLDPQAAGKVNCY